jgi:hypothetical protein
VRNGLSPCPPEGLPDDRSDRRGLTGLRGAGTIYRAPPEEGLERKGPGMDDGLQIILVLVGWFVLMRLVFPKLGVPT